ncbi:hypothetical protein [Paenibacillus sp. NPDC057967]|uniref:hypothetical protein n=1 Tax=Paenibacillus sp. NPDC057967 TaxID=3346293 RepID=UPI0036DAE95C
MIKKLTLVIALLLAFPLMVNASGPQMLLNSKMITSPENSYLGLENTLYSGDNGTRFYLLPKDRVTTGIGGAFKVFGDAYHKGPSSYRDLGIYFHADQNGDKGTNGNGVFWINSKSHGPLYNEKASDIAFGFQDGRFVAGRYSLTSSGTVFTIGKGNPTVAKLNPNIRAEVQGNLAFRNNDYIQWASVDGSRLFGITGDEKNKLKISSINGLSYFNNGVLMLDSDATKTDFKHALVTSKVNTVATATADATGANRVKLTTGNLITSIKGVDGQKVTVLFAHASATVQNNKSIKLQGGKNFKGGVSSTLVIENIEGVWYELSRSINN